MPVPSTPSATPAGIPESTLPGPFEVGRYTAKLREKLRSFQHVQLIGELSGVRLARARAYFELRDAHGALPCSAWREDWERMLARCATAPSEGMQVVVAGGCDYYPGSAASSPSFSFQVADMRVAGEGDLLARIERLRRQLHAEGLLELQKQLPRRALPRTIGVITGESGKARDDIVAALHRRGWAGRVVWGFAPVQDRHAAPAIVRALADLAAVGGVDVVVIARGGGSVADLLCFSDETLCRSVAMHPIPVVASVGHHTDRTLLDDVAAVSSSTPTHAAEAAVVVDCGAARTTNLAAARRLRVHSDRALGDRAVQRDSARRLRDHGRRAVLSRARMLSAFTRAPQVHIQRQRARLHQQLREIRAGSRRRIGDERAIVARRALVLHRKADSTLVDVRDRRPRELAQLLRVLEGHDPQRTLERGYALVSDTEGHPIASAREARQRARLQVRFADGEVRADVGER
ncbi:MAG TPA: exodeoxyribonuclease VII large subunit [Solirubrobacteraceae bacterium]|nr:exodeoxyribonuclease VII large subunit [Solirubrobacteraceae bacterium]